jgi:hypothetical protein
VSKGKGLFKCEDDVCVPRYQLTEVAISWESGVPRYLSLVRQVIASPDGAPPRESYWVDVTAEVYRDVLLNLDRGDVVASALESIASAIESAIGDES